MLCSRLSGKRFGMAGPEPGYLRAVAGGRDGIFVGSDEEDENSNVSVVNSVAIVSASHLLAIDFYSSMKAISVYLDGNKSGRRQNAGRMSSHFRFKLLSSKGIHDIQNEFRRSFSVSPSIRFPPARVNQVNLVASPCKAHVEKSP
jgi:hypothetical protein